MEVLKKRGVISFPRLLIEKEFPPVEVGGEKKSLSPSHFIVN